MKSPTSSSWRTWAANLGLAAPLLIIMGAFVVWPIFTMILRSFSGEPGEALTLERYAAMLTEPRYLTAFQNTALLAVFSTLLALIICVPAAIYIEGRPSPGRRLVALALTLPLSLPGIVVGFFVILAFGRTGVITDGLSALLGQRVSQIAFTFSGLLLAYVYFQVPRVTLVLRGSVSTISQDTIEAARTLGASTRAVFWYVILPTLRPALINAASLSLATAFGAYGTAATLSRGFRVLPLEIGALFTESFQPELASALSLALILVTTTLLLGVYRFGEQRKGRV